MSRRAQHIVLLYDMQGVMTGGRVMGRLDDRLGWMEGEQHEGEGSSMRVVCNARVKNLKHISDMIEAVDQRQLAAGVKGQENNGRIVKGVRQATISLSKHIKDTPTLNQVNK